MIDATGMPQSAVLLGGTSEIGREIICQLARRRLETVVLAGRDPAALESAAADVQRGAGAGALRVELLEWDATSPASSTGLAERARALAGDIDLAVMAAGDLGTAQLGELDGERVFEMMAVNVGGPAAALLEFAKAMAAAGQGRLMVLSSVAGLRVRSANFVYGAGKAGLDGFCLGLAAALAGSGVEMTVVRPGFVRTKMTEGRPQAPLSLDADAVARAAVRGLETSARIVYAPAPLKYLLGAMRQLPEPLWRKLPG